MVFQPLNNCNVPVFFVNLSSRCSLTRNYFFYWQSKLSKAQKNKKYIEKLKTNNKYEEYKKKKAEAIKKRREKQKKEEGKLEPAKREKLVEKRRKAVRKHVENYRKRKKNAAAAAKADEMRISATEVIAKGYRTKQTLGKAVKKVTKALPATPKRKKAVLTRIVHNLDENDRNELIYVISSVHKRTSMTDPSMIEDIHDFYERDDISRMSPKMRDVKKHVDAVTGEQVISPTRHMNITIKEAYAVFAEERKNDEKGYCH